MFVNAWSLARLTGRGSSGSLFSNDITVDFRGSAAGGAGARLATDCAGEGAGTELGLNSSLLGGDGMCAILLVGLRTMGVGAVGTGESRPFLNRSPGLVATGAEGPGVNGLCSCISWCLSAMLD